MLRPKINKLFVRYPEFGGNGHLEGEEGAGTAKGARDVRHDCDANERYLWLDGSVPPVEGMAVGHAVTMGRFRVWRSDNVAVQATGYWPGLDGLLAEAAACLWAGHHIQYWRGA